MKSYQEYLEEFKAKLETYNNEDGFIHYEEEDDCDDFDVDLIIEHFSNVLKEYENELTMKRVEMFMLKAENEEWRKSHKDEIKDNFVKNPETETWSYTATPNLKPHRKGLGLSKWFKK